MYDTRCSSAEAFSAVRSRHVMTILFMAIFLIGLNVSFECLFRYGRHRINQKRGDAPRVIGSALRTGAMTVRRPIYRAFVAMIRLFISHHERQRGSTDNSVNP